MIIERTSYPWTANAVLFYQACLKIGDYFYSIEVDSLHRDRNGIIIKTFYNDDCIAVDRYYYCPLFCFSQAVKQVFMTDYRIPLDFSDKFYYDSDTE